MTRINDWNENEKFSLQKIAQDVIKNNIQTSCCIDTAKASSAIETSCCIDTTGKIHDPHMSFIQSSCCIDTTKE